MTLSELGGQLRGSADFCCTNRCEITRVAEEEDPIVGDPVVERDLFSRRISCEIRGDVADMKAHSVGSFARYVDLPV